MNWPAFGPENIWTQTIESVLAHWNTVNTFHMFLVTLVAQWFLYLISNRGLLLISMSDFSRSKNVCRCVFIVYLLHKCCSKPLIQHSEVFHAKCYITKDRNWILTPYIWNLFLYVCEFWYIHPCLFELTVKVPLVLNECMSVWMSEWVRLVTFDGLTSHSVFLG